MPLPLLALGVATAVPKLWAAYNQSRQADNTSLQDTRPAAFLEKEAMARQRAASAVLPGMGAQSNRLAQIQSATVQNASLGAGSSADFLAAGAAAAGTRQQGEQQLATQGLAYQDGSRRELGGVLDQDAAYHTKDLDTLNKTKGAYIAASATNLDNAVEGAASYAALGLNAGKGAGLFGKAASPAGAVEPLTPLTILAKSLAQRSAAPAIPDDSSGFTGDLTPTANDGGPGVPDFFPAPSGNTFRLPGMRRNRYQNTGVQTVR